MNAFNCVTMYIEKATKQQIVTKLNQMDHKKKKMITKTKGNNNMDIDNENDKDNEHNHDHSHDDGLTVRIIYPHNLTDLASP